MNFSKWTKTNTSEIVRASRYTNRAIPTVNPSVFYGIAGIVTLASSWQLVQGDIRMLALPFGILVAIGLFAFARHLRPGGAYNLRRTMKADYAIAEPQLHSILSDMGVAFTRKVNTSLKTHSYEIPSHDLTVRITPYDMILGVEHGRDSVSEAMVIDSLGVLVTVHNVTEGNGVFAKQLTSALNTIADMQLKPAFA